MDVLGFPGMLQTTTSSFYRRDDQLEHCINMHGDNVGSLTQRLGYSILGAAISGAVRVNGLYSYADISGNTQRLFAYCDGKVSYYDGAAWQFPHTGLNSSAYAEFRVYLDQLFMVGATPANVYLTNANIDGTTYSTVTNLPTHFTGAKYIENFLDRLYMADVNVLGTRFASRFYYSDVPNAAGTTVAWTSTNYVDVASNDGEPIMGLHTNKSLNQLLIFKNSSLYAWDTFKLRQIGAVGTDCPRSVVTITGMTYFFKRGHGIYRYDGVTETLISRPIEKWIKGITDFTDAYRQFAGKEDEKYYKLYVGNITVDGTTYANCEIRYSTVDNTWTIYSYADAFTVYADHKISEVVRLYAGTTASEVMQMAANSDEVYTDNGDAIAYEWMTKALDLKMASSRKVANRAVVFCTNPQGLTGRVRSKGRDWSTFFTVNTPENYVNLSPQDGRLMQFHFSGVNNQEPCQFEGLSFEASQTTDYA